MKLLPTLTNVLLLVCLISCTNVQQFTLRDISQIDESKARSSTFVIGSLTHVIGRQNLTLWENLQWGAPAQPTNGWKCDMTVSIKQVLKGHVEQESITLQDLGPLSISPNMRDPWPYIKTPQTYYIGWQGRNSGKFSHLVLIPYSGKTKP
jgi:hypothetical protein